MEIFRDDEVEARVNYVSGGSGDRAKLSRYLKQTSKSLREQFRAAGWKVSTSDSGPGHMDVRASIPAQALSGNIDRAAKTIDQLFGNLKMDRV